MACRPGPHWVAPGQELLRFRLLALSHLTSLLRHPLPAGLADIVGRRFGKGNPLPWNPEKSWAGSAAMFLGACVWRAHIAWEGGR